MEKAIPRPEYPRPQMVRSQWMNLNGPWEFEMDFGSSGRQRRWFESASFTKKIVVPFCPESRLSRYRLYRFYAHGMVSERGVSP